MVPFSTKIGPFLVPVLKKIGPFLVHLMDFFLVGPELDTLVSAEFINNSKDVSITGG